MKNKANKEMLSLSKLLVNCKQEPFSRPHPINSHQRQKALTSEYRSIFCFESCLEITTAPDSCLFMFFVNFSQLYFMAAPAHVLENVLVFYHYRSLAPI